MSRSSEQNKLPWQSKKIIVCLAMILTTLSGSSTGQNPDFTRLVNPFIGTGGHGHTFPGATMPFGMVQLSPDTRIDNWDGSSGYHYSDDTIYGFSHTHLSGTGIPDGADILFRPLVGSDQSRQLKFAHGNEMAEPGYYSVRLDNGVFAELTASIRVGLHRYTFPNDDAALVLDIAWRDKLLGSDLKIVGENRIEGFRHSSSWAKNQKVFFVAEFSKPFNLQTTTLRGDNDGSERSTSAGQTIGAMLRFNPSGEKLLVKVAISYVSIEGARKNLEAELPHWDFDKVRAAAKSAWNKELSKIEISGGTRDQTTIFYTALYHTMIHPNVFNDVDGRYKGHDGKVHQLPSAYTPVRMRTGDSDKGVRAPSEHYTVFSLWDTFRAAHPLYTILDERRTIDFVNTFIRQYEQGGRLPVWELWGEETDTMIGYHVVSVIADAMAKGIKGFDYEKAYAAAKHSAELDHFGLKSYKTRGYISMEDENESVSKTLEYSYNDFCVATMAGILLKERKAKFAAKQPRGGFANDRVIKNLESEYQSYLQRAQYYKTLFDEETGFMRPRQNGGFVSPFKPNEVTFHFTEGNSWVYSFFVPHDVGGLIELYGGSANFARRLEELFTTTDKLVGREQPDITGLIGQYAHGNEPSHAIAYLFNYVAQPWKTQKLIRQINDEFYKNAPDGLIGNEDCGQMSAWFILSSLGFYQVNPSVPVYDIGTPLFKEAKIKLENGKSFVIKAPNVSKTDIYVKAAKLNGKPYRKTFFSHADIKKGGVFEFEMTDTPVADWFTEFSTSKVTDNFVATPIVTAKERVFKTSTEVSMKTNSKNAKILYSVDGSEPTLEYARPFTIDKTAIVRAVAVNAKSDKSQVVEAKLNRLPHDWTVTLFSKYNRQYTGGGDVGLLDGIRGTVNFASGEWQGYQSQDFIAVIDLQREVEVKRVGGGFLQVARSWIWMPTKIEFEASTDNNNWTQVAEIKTDVSPEDMREQFKDYSLNIQPIKTRYVRVKATNLGKIPAWHPGAGFDAFIFVDEILIN